MGEEYSHSRQIHTLARIHMHTLSHAQLFVFTTIPCIPTCTTIHSHFHTQSSTFTHTFTTLSHILTFTLTHSQICTQSHITHPAMNIHTHIHTFTTTLTLMYACTYILALCGSILLCHHLRMIEGGWANVIFIMESINLGSKVSDCLNLGA